MGALYGLSLCDSGCRPEENATDIVFLQVHHNSHGAVFKLKKFIGFCIAKTINTRYTIADGKHCTDFIKLIVTIDLSELLEQHLRHFAWFYFI